ncbi:alpha/beta hydrolase family protein [Rhodococcus sp. MTM3W5.2]|nr:alpha/beta hydrolase family protein [Rhodococcus sp. MTM3W5.2]
MGGLAALLVLVLIGGSAVVAGNSYALREERVTITTAAGPLRGVLALPRDARGPVGLVVFVHGDGPVEATSEGFYRPIWEALAEAGYASLSMSKPGVSGSQGNWLDQSLHDRAVEAETMIDWALDRPEIDARRIGLWGASQGGWVLPEVAVDRPEVSFVVAVSPAVNWLDQGRYNLLAELDATGAGEAERQAAIAESDAVRALLNRGAPYEEYLEASAEAEPMDRDRWGFVLRNHTADATAALGNSGAGTSRCCSCSGRTIATSTSTTPSAPTSVCSVTGSPRRVFPVPRIPSPGQASRNRSCGESWSARSRRATSSCPAISTPNATSSPACPDRSSFRDQVHPEELADTEQPRWAWHVIGEGLERLGFPDEAWRGEFELPPVDSEPRTVGRQDVPHPVRARSVHQNEQVAAVDGIRVERCAVGGAGAATHVSQHRPLPARDRARVEHPLVDVPPPPRHRHRMLLLLVHLIPPGDSLHL